MGSGMNARGAMEIIVATVGLGLGVLGGMGVLLGLAAVYLSMRRQRERNEGKVS